MNTFIPAWVIGTGFYLAVIFLVSGVLCWIAPHLLFGSEGYRTGARGIIGAVGALSMSIGICALLATMHKNASEMAAFLRIIILALAGAPAVVFYNLGALEPLRQATGVNIFLFVGGIFAFLLLPACLAFLALRKTTSTGTA